MNTVLSSKGQIVLPVELRQLDRLRAGQRFDVERLEAGHYLFKRRPPPGNEGLVDLLLACPEKGWFQSIESESTRSL